MNKNNRALLCLLLLGKTVLCGSTQELKKEHRRKNRENLTIIIPKNDVRINDVNLKNKEHLPLIPKDNNKYVEDLECCCDPICAWILALICC